MQSAFESLRDYPPCDFVRSLGGTQPPLLADYVYLRARFKGPLFVAVREIIYTGVETKQPAHLHPSADNALIHGKQSNGTIQSAP